MNNPGIGRQGIHIRILCGGAFDSYTVLRILTVCARSDSCPIDRVGVPARDWWPNEIFPITRSWWIVSVDPVSPPAFVHRPTSYHLLAVRCQFWSLTECLWLKTHLVQLSVTASAPASPSSWSIRYRDIFCCSIDSLANSSTIYRIWRNPSLQLDQIDKMDHLVS